MKISKYIDHTLLRSNATESDILKLCKEAVEYKFKSVCVNSYYVLTAKEAIRNSSVLICTVVGFPLGAVSKEVKAYEAKLAIENGADEIDMVINIGALKDKKYEIVLEDIKAVVEASKGKTVKVIIETCLLTKEEKTKACEIAVEAGANFVKTSTGFSNEGAKLEDIKLMKSIVGIKIGVKASGGIKTYRDTLLMIDAGASRIGTSSGIEILKGLI